MRVSKSKQAQQQQQQPTQQAQGKAPTTPTSPYNWVRDMHDPDDEPTTDSKGRKTTMDHIVRCSY